eukprot:6192708-Pleurochrysis_carterae.AAC.8
MSAASSSTRACNRWWQRRGCSIASAVGQGAEMASYSTCRVQPGKAAYFCLQLKARPWKKLRVQLQESLLVNSQDQALSCQSDRRQAYIEVKACAVQASQNRRRRDDTCSSRFTAELSVVQEPDEAVFVVTLEDRTHLRRPTAKHVMHRSNDHASSFVRGHAPSLHESSPSCDKQAVARAAAYAARRRSRSDLA